MPRGNHSSDSRKSPAVIAIIVVLLIAAAGGAFFLLKGGKTTSKGDGGGDAELSDETPSFDFEVRKVVVVPTVAGDKTSKEQGQAIAKQVSDTLSTFYKATYLDPTHWRDDNYSAAWSFFDKSAVADAKADAASLTLGDGSSYEKVEPKPGTTTVKILMGENGKPLTANAQVTFGVLASTGSGESQTIASMGQYFLKPIGKDWLIFGYKIEQSSEQGDVLVGSPPPSPKKTKPSPKASPS